MDYIQIENEKFNNNLGDFFHIKHYFNGKIENNSEVEEFFGKILEISDTIISFSDINNSNNYPDFLKFSKKVEVNGEVEKMIKKIFPENYSLHCNEICSNVYSCTIGSNIFFYKFNDIDTLKSFDKKIQKLLAINISIYTSIKNQEEMKKETPTININNIDNSINTSGNKNNINTSIEGNNTVGYKDSFFSKVISKIKSFFSFILLFITN